MRRKRSPNFAAQEKLKIIEIVSKHKNIIKSKLNTAESIKAKSKAWAEITREFNSENWTFKRGSLQLKLCYDNICKATKEEHKSVVAPTYLNTNEVVIKKDFRETTDNVPEICDPIIMESIKSETENTATEMELAEVLPCQQQQGATVHNEVNEIETISRRPDQSIIFTEQYNQQEMRFRQDEHDMDMQIKLQKLENERRINERLALEMSLLRLESKVMLKSLRTWNLKF